ncbi:glycoside hydrolase family 3 C-terminal domain-containing protein [Acidobacteria bacterium AH-259-L09]|nr:glycoside hydrolase family 3 C-terminal domain-containing protein [Acidobacteria bacterium AH-259-L09]
MIRFSVKTASIVPFFVCLIISNITCKRETVLPYKDPNLSLEKRVDDLVSRMTLQEKISQLVNDAPAIERLDIPKYNWWNECLHGVARAGRATVFPQAIGLAATWDEALMHRVSTGISDEARAKHHEFVRRGKRGIYQGLTFWSPNINIFRDPRWGRGMETYGEDPYLTGQMAIQFVKGLQGDDPKYLKAVATPKHYAVHSGPEPDRHTFDALPNERDLRETYLPHFEACIKEAKAFSVMCAYNRFEGEACCGSHRLLTEILRQEWGFEGYVVSDCGAIRDIHKNHKVVETAPQAAALGIKSGCDLNCGIEYTNLLEAVEKGLIAEEEIDVSVKRLYRARFKLGMFDPPEMVPYTRIPYEVNDSEKRRELALETGRKSIVLLKNQNALLPLRKDLGTIAVIGPNADDVEVLLGNYNGNPSSPVTLLQGIRAKVSPQTKVLHAVGCELAENLPRFEVIPSSALFTSDGPEKENGLKGEYFDSSDFNNRAYRYRESTYPNTGEHIESGPFTGKPIFSRIDKQIDFNWWDGSPHQDLDDDNFGVRWAGVLVPPVTGTYQLGARGFNAFEVYLEDELLVEFNNIHHPQYQYATVNLEAGHSYRIKVEFHETLNDANIELVWSVPQEDLEKKAVEAAKQADVVLMVMGLSPRLEGEEMRVPVEGFKGGDRLTLKLPEVQEKLLKTIYRLGKPIVLVLLNGSALAVNWANEHIPAIVEAWYPGQAAGTALADVLFGDYNPAGRLPVTFYKSVDQLPPFNDYNMKGRTYRYFEGDPLYPFGHGLSYTKFTYSNLTLPRSVRAGEDVAVSVKVENSGDMAGEEVVQLYLSDVKASVPVPIRALQGFKRIYLEAGEKRKVEFLLAPRQLSLIDKEYRRVVEPGTFEVTVGGKQPGFTGTADAATTETVTGQFEVIGVVVR